MADGIVPVNDSSSDTETTDTKKTSRLPADTDERKFLDSLDSDNKEDNKEEVEDNEESNEEDNEETEEGQEEEAEKDGKTDEEEEDDDELQLDDKDEDVSLYQRLKKEDKDIFKKNPDLRHVLFREQEFTKLFSSVEDAQSSKELADAFSHFQNDIEEGNAETFVEAISKLGDENLTEFSGNFLPALFKTNKDVYYEVVSPVIKQVLRAALSSDNENIRNSARNINHFLWQNTQVEKDEGFKPKAEGDKKKEDKVSQREREFEEKQYKSFSSDVTQVASNRLKKTISSSIKSLGLSEWSVKQMTEDIFRRTTESLSKDPRHMGNMDTLWKKAKAEGYTTEGKERLINTFLSRAKASVGKYRQQVLSEAKVSAKREDVGNNNGKKPIRLTNNAPGKSSGIAGKLDPKKIDWSKTNERDLLDGKAPTMKS